MSKDKLNLQSPWEIYKNKIIAIFGDDPEISINMIDADYGYNITLECTNRLKALALSDLLKSEVIFGNVKCLIMVIDKSNDEIDASIIRTAFTGNPHFEEIQESILEGFDATYCLFKKEVIQFYTDDLGDIHGLFSGLAEDIMRDISNESMVHYCTSTKD